MAQNPKIVKSKKSTASMRNSAGLRRREGMENMCCKNCGDMFGRPTKENKSCQYNAYDPNGKNWTEAKQIRITPKMQRRALASKSAQAKPKSQVTLKKAPWDKKKEQTEAFDFKVNIDGFPEMFMSGNSPSEVKANLRKLVKQPSMIKGVDRVTAHDKKKHHRDKMKESVDEGIKYTHAAIDKSGKVIGMASKESDAKDMARRNKGRVVKLKKPMSDKKGDMMINRPFKEGGMKRMSTGDGMDTFKKKPPEKTNEEVNEKVSYVEYKFKNDRDAKNAKKYFDGIQLMSFDVNDDDVRGGKLMVDAGKKDMTKYHKEVMKKFRPKVMTQESYAPDEGTPEARKKATKMTPGQEGVMDFLKNVGNTVMYGTQKSSKPAKKPRVNTNRGSTSGRQNSIASRINFGGKYGNK